MTQQWKPIESAPKDGSRVLIWHPDYCAPITAQWYGSEGWKMDSDVSPFWQQPTHWMPLPDAPCPTCNDQGAVGNILNAEPCPDCTPPASAQDDAKEWGPAFDAWFITRGVWPRVTYEEIFAAGWNARPVAAPAAGDAQTAAAGDVLAERQRQISVEGWDPERDDTYRHGELAMAAASYAQCAGLQGEGATTENAFKEPFAENWPWSETWWKPSAEPRRNLVKAGALILAEIERLDRAASQQQEG